MTLGIGQRIFRGGLLLYAISFWLTAVARPVVFATESSSIWAWAFSAFLAPLIYLHQASWGHLFEELNIAKASFFLNGWINPVFLLAMVLMLVDKTSKLTQICRYLSILMVPFCWIALVYQHVYPREGYVLWSLGMLLVLFSSDLEKRLSVVTKVSA